MVFSHKTCKNSLLDTEFCFCNVWWTLHIYEQGDTKVTLSKYLLDNQDFFIEIPFEFIVPKTKSTHSECNVWFGWKIQNKFWVKIHINSNSVTKLTCLGLEKRNFHLSKNAQKLFQLLLLTAGLWWRLATCLPVSQPSPTKPVVWWLAGAGTVKPQQS